MAAGYVDALTGEGMPAAGASVVVTAWEGGTPRIADSVFAVFAGSVTWLGVTYTASIGTSRRSAARFLARSCPAAESSGFCEASTFSA